VRVGMERVRGEAQTLGSARDCWVVDRLNIDPKAQEQLAKERADRGSRR